MLSYRLPAFPRPPRLYAFDWINLVNVIAVGAVLLGSGIRLPWLDVLDLFLSAMILLCSLIFSARLLDFAGQRFRAVLRGLPPPLWRRRGWWSQTLRLVFAFAVGATCYSVLKLCVPLLNSRQFDAQLDHLDRLLHFGVSPGIFMLTLTKQAGILRPLDIFYALFVPLSLIGTALLVGVRARRWRRGVATATVLIWTLGSWMYVAVPSFGPAYAYAGEWIPAAPDLPLASSTQEILMINYRRVQAADRDLSGDIKVTQGIGAFPSLHVGAIALIWMFMRKRFKAWRHVYLVATVLIFIGSAATGWHYALDSYAGLLLSLICHRVGVSVWRGRLGFPFSKRRNPGAKVCLPASSSARS